MVRTTENQTSKRKGLSSFRKRVFSVSWRLAVVVLLLAAASFAFGNLPARAAACPAPVTDNGTDTISVNVATTSSYVVWTRMMAADSSNNAINLQIDASTCYNVGDGSAIPANTWTWVNYADGATGTPITVSLSAGTHTFKYIGTDPGVTVDRVILYSDTSCVPTGTGNNCQTGDSTPPTVSLVSPANNATVTGITTLNASASDSSGIAQVRFLLDGTVIATDTSSPYSYSWDSSSASNGAHALTAQAVDNAGNTTTSSTVNVTVSNTVPCTANPSVPGNFRSTSTTSSTVSLAWNASTPGTGCTMQGYKIYRGGNLVTTVTSGTTYTDTGLVPSTTYSYTVAALDTSNHNSAQSSAVSATTAADTTPPSVPTNLHTTLIGTNTIALAWNASTDNVGVTSYIILRGGTQVGTSTTPSYTDTGLTADTNYTYTVKAVDARNNTSAASTGLSARTLSGTAASRGDLNNDSRVNITDLSIMLSHWVQSGVPVTQGDCNSDGVVNIIDLSILLSHWG